MQKQMDVFIDAVQDTKLKAVEATVKDDEIKAGLTEFVEAQRELSKVITKNANMIANKMFSFHNMCNPGK